MVVFRVDFYEGRVDYDDDCDEVLTFKYMKTYLN